ncbi:MAG: DNA cytosine methyltransferase [Opitutia bacterium]
MIYGSVCSGIEAATVAWEPLGWRAAFFSEIEAFPRAVLHHRFPHVPLHGDFTTIKADEYEPIDLLVGGTPCQSFSIAGLRGGLGDDRGNLSLQFLRLADRTRARWVLWENVPGVLSSFQGRDFGAIVTGLVELGYGCAWRVLDAQYFGVAQRRRRVFLVGYSGGWRGAAAVLFERASLQGNPPPRRETRESVAGTLGGSSQSGGFRTTDLDNSGAFIPVQANTPMSFGHGPNPLDETLVAFGGNRTSGPIDVTPALLAQPGSGFKCDFESETFITTAFAHQQGGSIGLHTSDDCALTLQSHQGQAVAFDTTQITSPGNFSNPKPGDACHPLAAEAHAPAIAYAAAVRRLTPRECERLQGFPDDYTLIPWRGKPAAECPDGPRYKALGNSMAVPVVRWIGRRIAMVDAILKENTK